MAQSGENAALYALLDHKRRLAWCVIVFERLWPFVLSLLLVACCAVIPAWFNLYHYLPWPLHIGWLLVLGGVGLYTLVQLTRKFHFPDLSQIDRHIETASGVSYQAISVQEAFIASSGQQPIDQDPISIALWQVHRDAMAQQLHDLHVGLPHPSIPAYDPYALRVVIIFLSIIAFAYSFGARGGNLYMIGEFGAGSGAPMVAQRLDAWIDAPAYTQHVPIYIKTINQDMISVPKDSVLQLRLSPPSRSDKLVFAPLDGTHSVTILPENDENDLPTYHYQFDQAGHLQLRDGTQSYQWTIDVIGDAPPSVELLKEPERALNGLLKLTYAVDDDYGIAKAWLEITPLDEQGQKAQTMVEPPLTSLNIPRSGTGETTSSVDLKTHPWAGMDAEIRLVVEDAVGQRAQTSLHHLVLPEQSFSDPMARAIVELRRLLAIDIGRRDYIGDVLYAFLLRPEDSFADPVRALILQSLRTRLQLVHTQNDIENTIAYMWDIAEGFEGSNVTTAQRRLLQAQQALRDALRNGASEKEIAQLMQELRQAMANYMQELAQHNQNHGTTIPSGTPMDGAEKIEELMRRLEELSQQGNMAAAEQVLAQLNELLANMIIMPGTGGEGEGTQSDNQQNSLDRLADIMRQQQSLMDDTYYYRNNRDNAEGQEGGQRSDLEQRQQQLRSDLEQLQNEMRGEGAIPNELNEALESMQRAQQDLAQDDMSAGLQEQANALENLRQGARAWRENQDAGQNAQQNQDPLGREMGAQPSWQNDMPSESDMQRARRLLDLLREKLGDAERSQSERNYFQRLLNFD